MILILRSEQTLTILHVPIIFKLILLDINLSWMSIGLERAAA